MDRRGFVLRIGSVAGALALRSSPLAAAVRSPAPRTPAARPLRVLELSGPPREAGRQHGEALREEIRANVEGWTKDANAPEGTSVEDYVAAFLGKKGTTDEELGREIANNIQQLPGRFETSEAVLAAMQSNDLLGRPDTYHELLAAKYRGQTQASVDEAMRAAVSRQGFVWVVVGDAAKIRPQLEKLGMPIEVAHPR